MEPLMAKPNDLSKSLVALDQESTLIAVIESGELADRRPYFPALVAIR
jgi:hypothetical protein